MIIGFGHQARVGKDTSGDYLKLKYDFTKLSFAGPLKEAAKIIYGLTEDQLYGDLKEVVDEFWGETPRHIIQKMGTDGIRNGHRKDVWVKATERKILKMLDKNIVICDVRFPEEADMIHRLGGKVYKLTGSFGGRVIINSNMHESETIMLDYQEWDGIIDNNSNVEYLFSKLDEVVGGVV